MIESRNIIVFSDEWGRHPFSCQHILKHFLPCNNIIWVTPTGMRNPTFTWYDFKRSVEKLRAICRRNSAATEDLTGPKSITPFAIPYSQFPLIRFLNRQFVMHAVRTCCTPAQLAQLIIITTLPITADYVRMFAGRLVVYYCVDDFTHWPGVNGKLISTLENRLIENSDLIIVSSDELARVKDKPGKEAVTIPHGVDFELFETAGGYRERNSATKPVIGFFGALSPWLDYELLHQIAVHRKDWSLVFIGPCDTDISRFSGLENVFFAGKVPYAELPVHAARFDVGIIPFIVNDLTVSVNPLKLLEYLACGLPVVTTDLPEVRKFAEYVSIASGPDEFIRAIESELARNTPELAARRQMMASSHSWKSVAEQFSTALEGALARPGGDDDLTLESRHE
jgi:glycosyltransferase involved in cell wall biosynthesis